MNYNSSQEGQTVAADALDCSTLIMAGFVRQQIQTAAVKSAKGHCFNQPLLKPNACLQPAVYYTTVTVMAVCPSRPW